MEPEEYPLIESPISLIPDLTTFGIKEVDSGVCEDTFENREILRQNKCRWTPLFNSDGTLSGNIQVITPEMIDAMGESKKAILTNASNKNSDYLTGLNLLMEPMSDRLAPAWVIAATRHWVKVEEIREDTGKHYRPALASAPGRCSAKRTDGSRCWNWHGGRATEGGKCKIHNGQREDDTMYTERARNRVRSASVAAVEQLERLLHAASEPVQLKAATELLDRAGIRGGTEIDANVKHEVIDAGALIMKKLEKLAPKEVESGEPEEKEAIEEAVVVEDDDR